MMPQLLSARIGGVPAGEVTIASTTQMVDPEERTWATDLLEELSVPTDLLPPLSEPDNVSGRSMTTSSRGCLPRRRS